MRCFQSGGRLVVLCVAGEVVLSANASRLLPVDSLQLGAVGDSVAETAAIGATSFSVGLHELLFLGLKVGQEVRHCLSRFDEQMLQVEENGVLHRLVDKGCGVALLVATTCVDV